MRSSPRRSIGFCLGLRPAPGDWFIPCWAGSPPFHPDGRTRQQRVVVPSLCIDPVPIGSLRTPLERRGPAPAPVRQPSARARSDHGWRRSELGWTSFTSRSWSAWVTTSARRCSAITVRARGWGPAPAVVLLCARCRVISLRPTCILRPRQRSGHSQSTRIGHASSASRSPGATLRLAATGSVAAAGAPESGS